MVRQPPGASASPAAATTPAPAASSSSVRHAHVRFVIRICFLLRRSLVLVLKAELRRKRAFPLETGGGCGEMGRAGRAPGTHNENTPFRINESNSNCTDKSHFCWPMCKNTDVYL